MAQSDPALVIDIGGTKFAAGLAEPDGRLITSAQVPTPPGQDAETLWQALDGLLSRVLSTAGLAGRGLADRELASSGPASSGLAGVGCGCGGPMRWPAGLISPLNIPGWRDFPLRDRLAERFGGVPVRVHNDAICMAAGEHWRGAGQGCRNMLGMVVSTGVGGGLVLDGTLIAGNSGNAGHIGHVVVDPEDGPPCACGGRGCLEAIARGPALAAWAQRQGWRPDQPGASARQLAADAAQGHPVGLAALRRAGRAAGIAIASATALCDLEAVVIGGGLSQAGPLLLEPLEQELRRHARIDFARDVRVVTAALGQNAGLVGAAALIFRPDRYWAGD